MEAHKVRRMDRPVLRVHVSFEATRTGPQHLLEAYGKVENGRTVNQVGAHVEGWNSISLGICLIGGISEAGRRSPSLAASTFLRWSMSWAACSPPPSRTASSRGVAGASQQKG
ncbi:hypothetical protein [Mesorhizobium sp. CN2-181]|uniref:hypothetical protein n=1 Tax=Mesorhizobium yinganensis TaxID=3157707 RepID=UPI0032B76CD4